LDEPFSGFDPVNANLIKDEILELREKGSTIIFSTHRMESVEQLCDHIAMINLSEKILDGTKKEIKNSYKSNTFLVSHKGNLTELSDGFSLLENVKDEEEDDMSNAAIKINSAASPNDLLSELIKVTEVHSFIEKIPSINDIFIAKAEGGNHE